MKCEIFQLIFETSHSEFLCALLIYGNFDHSELCKRAGKEEAEESAVELDESELN